MKEVMFKIPLTKLYKLEASCQYNEDSNFCPVLVRITDKQVLKEYGGKLFLLQVYNRAGEMVFERPLDQPVVNWNISGDNFVFQEYSDVPIVYVVKLYVDKMPIIFKFKLPAKVLEG